MQGATVLLSRITELADVFGQVASSCRAVAGVGIQNTVEAEIQRRQVSRPFGGVGTQNAIEAEIYRRIFSREGAEAALVGRASAFEANLLMRLVTVTIRTAPF